MENSKSLASASTKSSLGLRASRNFEDFGARRRRTQAGEEFRERRRRAGTEKRTAQILREVSEKLTEAAAWIEARNAARSVNLRKTRNHDLAGL